MKPFRQKRETDIFFALCKKLFVKLWTCKKKYTIFIWHPSKWTREYSSKWIGTIFCKTWCINCSPWTVFLQYNYVWNEIKLYFNDWNVAEKSCSPHTHTSMGQFVSWENFFICLLTVFLSIQRDFYHHQPFFAEIFTFLITSQLTSYKFKFTFCCAMISSSIGICTLVNFVNILRIF